MTESHPADIEGRRDDALDAIRSALARVAPDADADAIDLDEDFRDAADLDSMDFLNVMIALHDLTGVEVPERRYPELSSFRALAQYVAEHRVA